MTMSEIAVTLLAPGTYGVEVQEGATRTSHRVTVPSGFLEALAVADVDDERLVRESFSFLLEREPATSILREFPLDRIGDYFPDYVDELRSRLARA